MTGTIKSPDDLAKNDYRRTLPRFQGEAFTANLRLVEAIKEIAQRKGPHVTPSQIVIAWLMKQGDVVIPIPGTTKEARLRENLEAARESFVITDEEEKAIRKAIKEIDIAGERYDPGGLGLTNA